MIKRTMAARVAAQLQTEGIEVETVKGGLGEFSVTIDGDKVIDTSRLWYPRTGKVVAQLRALLAQRQT
ncbi:MAG: hypothetical protein ACJ74W_03725 [Pyrinomonadaceae bacterium]